MISMPVGRVKPMTQRKGDMQTAGGDASRPAWAALWAQEKRRYFEAEAASGTSYSWVAK